MLLARSAMEPTPLKPYSHAPSPLPPAAARQDEPAGELLRLSDVAAFVRRHGALMAATALAFTLLAVALLWALHRPTYRAVALLLVSDQTAPQGLRPPVLPVDGYARLLASRTLLRQAERRLDARGALPAPSRLSADRIAVRPIEVRRGEMGSAALLELQASGATGEEAAAVANACSEALIDLDAWSARRVALERTRLDIQEDHRKLAERAARLAERLEASRRQLSEVPPLLTVRSRLSEKALLPGATTSLEGPGPALVTQEPNPLYNQLATRHAELELDAQGIGPQLAEAERSLAEVEAALARLAGAEGLGDGREDSAASLGEAPAAASPPSAAAVARALSVAGAVSMLRPAVAPARPQPGRLLFKAVSAAGAGVILAFLLAAAREGWRGRVPR